MIMARTERMEQAFDMAIRCWGRAYNKQPHFVERYLELAEEYLQCRVIVTGDQFKDYCNEHLLFLPTSLHHNTWVSGVKALETIGWVKAIGKTEPTKGHNHMNDVTLWRSMIYDGSKPNTPEQLRLEL
jgi:hypothetical protein